MQGKQWATLHVIIINMPPDQLSNCSSSVYNGYGLTQLCSKMYEMQSGI
jgi:hypothetical protein